MNLLKDDKGNWSSLRVLLFLFFGLLILMYFDWRWAFRHEVLSTTPANYEGLTKLFIAMFVCFISAIFAKLLQKKFENSKNDDNEKRG